jgi:hypothetical protein
MSPDFCELSEKSKKTGLDPVTEPREAAPGLYSMLL